MNYKKWKDLIRVYDDRRDIIIPGDFSETMAFCSEQFIHLAKQAIDEKGAFYVALSGGSTPKSLYQLLATPTYKNLVDWSKVHLFWSDERCVSSSDPQSNFFMAMDAGFSKLPLSKNHIYKMPADNQDLEKAASDYETLIERMIPDGSFDLIMLGIGEDGHTASLFPQTHGLHADNRLVVANYVPSKEIWRMTFTYNLINAAKAISIYVTGKSKAEILSLVLKGQYDPDVWPIQKVGSRKHKALFIVDTAASTEIHNSSD